MKPLAPSIVITMGDPAGVGPEIICKALADMPAEARRDIAVAGNIPLTGAGGESHRRRSSLQRQRGRRAKSPSPM